jgi:transcriptional regulator with XRE-family HTH domain
MRFMEIGQQLRAYRLESGLRAEEIAARLGVSRAALYRYEKGEVIKLDTINRLAELLNISPLSLLGIGVEYYNRPIGYQERLRQLEETADQILEVASPVCYLTTSNDYDRTLAAAFDEAAAIAPDPTAARAATEQVLGILAARKRTYAIRRPGIIGIVSLARLRAYLAEGIAPGIATSERTRRQCRDVAVSEVESIAVMMESEPMGLQYGTLTGIDPTACFKILRTRERAGLTINGFLPDTLPTATPGVAMITAADEAIAAHQRVAEALWRQCLKGPAAASAVRKLLTSTPAMAS